MSHDCYTDYPIMALGDVSREKAPIRRVFPIMSDGDKRAKVLVLDGSGGHVLAEMKWGYLYPSQRRSLPPRQGQYYDVSHLEVDLDTYLSLTMDETKEAGQT